MLRIVQAIVLAMAAMGLALSWPAPSSAQQAQAQAQSTGETAKPKAPRKPSAVKPKTAEGGSEAVDAEAAIDKARRALAEGKVDAALALADSVINGAKKDARNTARALAVRGEGRLKQGRQAEAIADLDNALWVKGGLAGAERESAAAARGLAMRQSGLEASPPSTAVNPTPAVARAQPPVANAATAAPSRPSEPASVASAPPSAAPASGGGIGGFFSNLFGGGSSQSEAAARPPRAPATTATLPTVRPTEPAVSASEPQRAEPRPARSSAPPTEKPVRAATATTAAAAARPATTAPDVAGGYRIQLAAVRSKAEAQAMAETVRKSEAAALANRSFEIVEDVYGNMGKFYRARIGPFAGSAEATAVCTKLRLKQQDCMVLDQ